MRGGRRPKEPGDLRIDRAGPWGNPFRLKAEADREAVARHHRKWLLEQYLASKPPYDRIASIADYGAYLCWCAPKRCHGEALREAALKARDLSAAAFRAWCRRELAAMIA